MSTPRGEAIPPPPPSQPFMTPSPPTMSATGEGDGAASPPHSRFYKHPSASRPPYPAKRPSAMTLEDLAEIRAMPTTPDFSPGVNEGLKVLSGVMREHYAGMERRPGGSDGSPPSREWEARERERRKRENDRSGDVPTMSLDQRKARDTTQREDEGRTARYFERLVKIRPTNWSDRKHAPVLKALWDAYMMEGENERSWSKRMDEAYDRVGEGMRVLFPELEEGKVKWSANWMGEMLKKVVREERKEEEGRRYRRVDVEFKA